MVEAVADRQVSGSIRSTFDGRDRGLVENNRVMDRVTRSGAIAGTSASKLRAFQLHGPFLGCV